MDNAFFFCVNNKKVLSLFLSRQQPGTTRTGRTFTDITSQYVSVSFNVTCAVKKKRDQRV